MDGNTPEKRYRIYRRKLKRGQAVKIGDVTVRVNVTDGDGARYTIVVHYPHGTVVIPVDNQSST